jgi:hypothetical protein
MWFARAGPRYRAGSLSARLQESRVLAVLTNNELARPIAKLFSDSRLVMSLRTSPENSWCMSAPSSLAINTVECSALGLVGLVGWLQEAEWPPTSQVSYADLTDVPDRISHPKIKYSVWDEMLTSIHPCWGSTRAGTPLLVIALLPSSTRYLIVAVFLAVTLSLAYKPSCMPERRARRLPLHCPDCCRRHSTLLLSSAHKPHVVRLGLRGALNAL